MIGDLLPGEERALRAARDAGFGDAFLSHLPSARTNILERLISALTCEGLPRGDIEALVRPATLTGRLALDGPVRRGAEVITSPVRVAEILGLGELIRSDLEDSVSNYALALTGAEARRSLLRGASALECARATPSPLAFFEQWVIDGHPLQPGAKIKLGLSPEDAIRYSPEWGARFDVPIAAIPAEKINDMGMTDLLLEQHAYAVRDRPAGHALLPLHPWQAARAGVPVLPGEGIPVRPLMSFRTLAPLSRPDLPYPSHLKTAVGIQLTGAVRGVSAQAAENGPRLSGLLETILRREDHFGGRLGILAEVASAHVEEPSLGAIARVNPEAGLADGETVMPVAALMASSPVADGPIIGEVASDARLFAARYAEVAVGPLLTLCHRYGVALEAHPQNTLVVLKDGLPVRLLVRDLGAIRVDLDRLRDQGLDVRLRAGSPQMSDAQATRDKLYFSLFVNHVGELLAALSRASGVPQERLWEPFAGEAGGTVRGPLPMKRMLSMRMSGAVTDESFVPAPNPMRELP